MTKLTIELDGDHYKLSNVPIQYGTKTLNWKPGLKNMTWSGKLLPGDGFDRTHEASCGPSMAGWLYTYLYRQMRPDYRFKIPTLPEFAATIIAIYESREDNCLSTFTQYFRKALTNRLATSTGITYMHEGLGPDIINHGINRTKRYDERFNLQAPALSREEEGKYNGYMDSRRTTYYGPLTCECKLLIGADIEKFSLAAKWLTGKYPGVTLRRSRIFSENSEPYYSEMNVVSIGGGYVNSEGYSLTIDTLCHLGTDRQAIGIILDGEYC